MSDTEPTGAPSQADGRPDNPGVVAHPPVIYAVALALGLGLDYLLVPAPFLSAPLQYWLAAALIAVGLGIAGLAIRRFLAAGTNVPTPLPATVLVIDGIYRFSRNPIYLGLNLNHLGIGVAVDSLWIVGLLVPVLAIMRYGVIGREERYLEGKFGEPYRRYKATVRRWL